MDKRQLLKYAIGTLGIYLIFLGFSAIFYHCLPYHGGGVGPLANIGSLSNISYAIFYYAVCLPLCGIAGGLLFKGKIPIWMWAAATVLFAVFLGLISGGCDSLLGVVAVLPFPIIPFLIVKLCFYAYGNTKKQ
ncbi:MAG: hypothetical protein K2N38_02730 [Oscillospiraceae bacterium]|nr:hypothetical protein [Oscillospiraceae bacterium]